MVVSGSEVLLEHSGDELLLEEPLGLQALGGEKIAGEILELSPQPAPDRNLEP